MARKVKYPTLTKMIQNLLVPIGHRRLGGNYESYIKELKQESIKHKKTN